MRGKATQTQTQSNINRNAGIKSIMTILDWAYSKKKIAELQYIVYIQLCLDDNELKFAQLKKYTRNMKLCNKIETTAMNEVSKKDCSKACKLLKRLNWYYYVSSMNGLSIGCNHSTKAAFNKDVNEKIRNCGNCFMQHLQYALFILYIFYFS